MCSGFLRAVVATVLALTLLVAGPLIWPEGPGTTPAATSDIVSQATGTSGARVPSTTDIISAGSEASEAPRYHTVDEIESQLQAIANNHSNIASLESLGTTVEGRDIWALKVSDHPELTEDGEPGTEPGVLYVGVHHANEWLGAEVLLHYLDLLVASYGAEKGDLDEDGLFGEDRLNGRDDDGDGAVDEDPLPARATWLVNNRELWFVVLLNPDGMAYDMAQGPEGADWRKNREPNPGGSVGTDLNRNYPWHWGEPGVNDPNPESDFYEGPPDLQDNDGDNLVDEDKVDGYDNDGDGDVDEDRNGGFSTRETRAMGELVERENITMALTYHTAGNQILYPWGYTTDQTPEDDLFQALAGEMASMNGYEVLQGSDLYPTAGEFTDWLYGSHGIYGFTIELADQSGGNEYVDPELIEPISKLNLPVNLYVAERAGEPYVALDPDLGPPVVALEPVPANEPSDKSVTLKVKVTAADGSNLSGAKVLAHYVTRNAPWPIAQLTEADPEEFSTVILEPDPNDPGLFVGRLPSRSSDGWVYFFISARGDDGPEGLDPLYAPNELHSYRVSEDGASGLPFWTIGSGIILAMVILGFLRDPSQPSNGRRT